MRHGPAEDHSKTGRDEDRELTHVGRVRVRGVVGWLVKEGELPSRILTSRLVRAAETAEIVASSMARRGPMEVEVVGALAPGPNALELVRRLQIAADTSTMGDAPMIVGHEPDLSGLVDRLLGESMPVGMDKAMVVCLELDGEKATLRFILDPKSLDLVEDHRGA